MIVKYFSHYSVLSIPFAHYLLEQDFDIIIPVDSHRLEYCNRNMPE